MAFSVTVLPDTFRLSKAGVVTGVTYIDVDAQCFSWAGWYDFPVVILGWWLEAIVRLRDDHSLAVRCLFMDGPFYFNLAWGSGLSWTIECVKRRAESDWPVVPATDVDSESVIKSITEAVDRTSVACELRLWYSDDVATLQNRLIAARKLLGNRS